MQTNFYGDKVIWYKYFIHQNFTFFSTIPIDWFYTGNIVQDKY